MIRYVKIFLNYLLVLIISKQTYGQAKLRDDILPHSPEAAAFEKNVENPVTLYTGLPGVSIPVYEIKSGELSIPMQLSYNYSGYRPSEEATWVGLGWNLNAGGCITRSVRGSVDGSSFITTQYEHFVDIAPLASKQKYLQASAEGQFDTEPDLYTFNFGGYSGKFLWINGEAVLVPNQDLDIKKGGSFGQEFFTIKIPEGVVYTFDVRETTEQRHFGAGIPATPTHTSAWFVSEIKSPGKLHQVNFTYTDYVYRPRSQYSYQFTETRGGSAPTTNYSEIGTSFPLIHSKQLHRIYWDDYVVLFEKQPDSRLDLLNNSSHALKAIHISNSETVIKNIILNQLYVGGITTPTKMLLKEVEITTMQTDANGNFLSESKGAGKYSFNYQQENSGFPVETKSIDYGNYFNGHTNTSLFPCGFIPPSLMPPCGNRAPDLAATIIGALRKITYPTGGYTTFDYEQNTVAGGEPQPVSKVVQLDFAFLPPNPQNLPSTISKEIAFKLDYDQTVTFEYGRILPSGVAVENNTVPIMKIFSQQSYGTNYTGRLFSRTEQSLQGTVFLPAGYYILEATCQNDFAEVFAHIHYTIAGTYSDKPAPGLRISKITSYDNLNQINPSLVKKLFYQDASGHSSGILLAGPTISEQVVQNIPAYQLGGSAPPSETHTFSAEASSPINAMIDVPFYYARVTEVNGDETVNGKTVYEFTNSGSDACGVDLVRRTELKYNGSDFVPVKEQINTYTITNKRTCNFWKAQLVGTGLGFTNPDNQDASSRQNFYAVADGGVGVVRSSYKLLMQTLDLFYDENGQNPYTKEVNFEYSNPLHHFPTAKIEYNSKGEMIRTEMKYPLDYEQNQCENPDMIESMFNTSVSDALSEYYACSYDRGQSLLSPVFLQPYFPNNPTNQNQFTSIINNSPCEENLKSSSTTIWTARKNRMSNYSFCLQNMYLGEPVPEKRAVWVMKKQHIISPVLEQYVSIYKNGIKYILSAIKTDYAVISPNTSNETVVPAVIKQVDAGNLTLTKDAFIAAPDNYYKPEVYFVYNNNKNLIEQYKVDNMPVSYLWDYHNQYTVAEVINVNKDDIFAYNSFEAENKHGFTFNGTIEKDRLAEDKPTEVSSITGNHFYMLQEAHQLYADLNPEVSYVVSLWKKGEGNVKVNGALPQILGRTVGEWRYCEWRISGYTKLAIAGNDIPIDEVRLYPSKAHMNTYTYSPGKGIRDKCDINNRINYYYYDGIGRLQLIRNQDKNVLKKFCYNYAGEQSECGDGEPSVFESNLLTKTYTKNCGTGNFTTCKVPFTVAAGMFTSTISQDDADAIALNYANITGQATADNTACACIPITDVIVKSVNNGGLQNTIVTFTNVTTGAVRSFGISQLSGLRNVGTIDSGIYNITIERPNYISYNSFSLNCGSLTIQGQSATFSNVNISSTSCNVITLGIGVN